MELLQKTGCLFLFPTFSFVIYLFIYLACCLTNLYGLLHIFLKPFSLYVQDPLRNYQSTHLLCDCFDKRKKYSLVVSEMPKESWMNNWVGKDNCPRYESTVSLIYCWILNVEVMARKMMLVRQSYHVMIHSEKVIFCSGLGNFIFVLIYIQHLCSRWDVGDACSFSYMVG